MLCFLIAVALYGSDYHGGQWSDEYRWQCEARVLLLRWYQIRSPEDWIDASYVTKRDRATARAIYFGLIRKYRGSR